MFNSERFLTQVGREDFPELTVDEVDQLGKVLSHPTVQKSLANVLRSLMSTKLIFLSIHLDSIGGISEMIRLQGRIEGYTGFVEALAAFATRESDDDEQLIDASGVV